MQKRSPQLGFTVIELVIVIVLLGILVAGSANMIHTGFNSFFNEKNIVNAYWQVNVASERMTRDLRAVRSNSNDILTATNNDFKFVGLDNNTIEYKLNGNQLQRIGATTQVLAASISALNFAYYDANGAAIASPVTGTALATIRYVVITITVSYNNIAFPTTTGIYLWAIT